MSETEPVAYVHSVPQACRLLPSSSRWNSIELDFNLLPRCSNPDHSPSKFSKSYEFKLSITDRKIFNRFMYISGSLVLAIIAAVLLGHFLVRNHPNRVDSRNYTIPVHQALWFFDAQKSGILPKSNSVKFRGDSGLQDGNSSKPSVDLVGGFYDSGNNIKFSFPTAYTVTLLSWTVIEYHEKYSNVGELEHIKDIIKWGSAYLLKVFNPPSPTSGSTLLYSQVGSSSNTSATDNDINCWQRPEDMAYPRPVSACKDTASDLAGEVIAALSAASLVFKDEKVYSAALVKAAEQLFGVVTKAGAKQGTYTMDDECGGEARQFYNSSGYLDELVWGGTWLFFATGNTSYFRYTADENLKLAMDAELEADRGVFDWNNKLAATAVLLTRLRYFRDPGFPYEEALKSSTNMTNLVMCSYLSQQKFNTTPGGLMLLRFDSSAPLQYAATASFLSKLYKDYLDAQKISGVHCGTKHFSAEMLQTISISQVEYILGNNPKKMSYLVGFGDSFPNQVHHRAASIPWDNQHHSCEEGKKWLNSKDPNPNVLTGSMVAGPDEADNFVDSRDWPRYTEPTISGNAGLVAALIALHELPRKSSALIRRTGGLDQMGIFANIRG